MKTTVIIQAECFYFFIIKNEWSNYSPNETTCGKKTYINWRKYTLYTAVTTVQLRWSSSLIERRRSRQNKNKLLSTMSLSLLKRAEINWKYIVFTEMPLEINRIFGNWKHTCPDIWGTRWFFIKAWENILNILCLSWVSKFRLDKS